MLCVPKYYGESFAAQTRPAGKVTIYVHCSFRGGLMPQRSVDIVKAVLARRQDVDVRLRLCKHFSPSPELNAAVERRLKGLNVEILPAEQTPYDS